jgi:hypothetical protein
LVQRTDFATLVVRCHAAVVGCEKICGVDARVGAWS